MKCLFRRRKEARPGEIAAAALELFVDKGFAATRIDDIAAQAGVSKGTVYLYFDSKEALFKAAVEATMLPAIEKAETLVADDSKPAAEMLRESIFGWWEMVRSTSLVGVPKLLVAESSNFPEAVTWFHEAVMGRAHGAMARIIERGIARGEFRPVAALVAARIVFAPMFSFLVWRRSFERCMPDLPPAEEFFALAVDMLVHGLSAKESIK
jgi:AcrR family transcriptional regulator